MATTSAILLLADLATGESNVLGFSNWGEAADSNFAFLEDTIGEISSISLGSSDVTLTAAEERSLILQCSGTLTANVNVITNDRKGFWIVDNNTTGSFTVTVKPNSGTGVEVGQGKIALVWFDGTNIQKLSNDDHTHEQADITGLAAALALKANLASPALTGNPTAPTQLLNNSSTRLSNTEFVAKLHRSLCQGRLTLQTGNPIPTADQTAATDLYWTPYMGNLMGLYDNTNSKWIIHDFSEDTLSLSGYTADTNYDIFMDYNSGSPQMASEAWSSDSARNVALTTQDGIYVKSGDVEQRYLGTIRITGTTGQCEDSSGGSNDPAKRFVWNYYNRVERDVSVYESATTWSYTTATMRQMNANTNMQVEFVVGVAEDSVNFQSVHPHESTATASAAIGLDSTSAEAADCLFGFGPTAGVFGTISAHLKTYVAAGYHFVAPLESGNTGTDWYGFTAGGRRAGITGQLRA